MWNPEGTDLCESASSVLSVMIMVGQIVSDSLSVFHDGSQDRLQVEDQVKKIHHNCALFSTASGEREYNGQ